MWEKLKCMICKNFKMCKEECDQTEIICKKKCSQCMKQSKVALVKNLAGKIPNQYTGVKDYVLNRLVPQMLYYGTESLRSKRKYMRWTTLSLIATGIIPIITIFLEQCSLKNVIITSLSSFITFVNAYLLTTNSKNTWILYRETRERLFNEFYKFYSIAFMYNNLEANGAEPIGTPSIGSNQDKVESSKSEEVTEVERDNTSNADNNINEEKAGSEKSSIDNVPKLAEKMIENCEKLMMKQMDDWLGLVMDAE